MSHSPEERERVARKLRQKDTLTEHQIQQRVDNSLLLAAALLKVWSRHMARRQKLPPPTDKPARQQEPPPT